MTGLRDSLCHGRKRSYGTGVTDIGLEYMKSEAIGEEDTTADSAVSEH